MVDDVLPNHICFLTTTADIEGSLRTLIRRYVSTGIQVHLLCSEEVYENLRKGGELGENFHFSPISKLSGDRNQFDLQVRMDGLYPLLDTEEPLVLMGELQSIDNFKDQFGQIAEYEVLVNEILLKPNISTYCIYNRDFLDEDQVESIIMSHPYVYYYGQILKNLSFNDNQNIRSICSACKKERQGTVWKYRQGSLLTLDESDYSHGICPDCRSTYE